MVCHNICERIYSKIEVTPIWQAKNIAEDVSEGKRKLYCNSISKNDIAKATCLSSLSRYKGGMPSINK
jgi:hypothetical protein